MRKTLEIMTAVAMLAATLTGCGTERASITMDQAEVTLGGYKGLEIQVSSPEVTDGEVEQAVQAVIDAWNSEAPSDKQTVEEGDTVMCIVRGTLADGTEIEDGADMSGFITPGTDQTYPEVEQALIGMNVGEEKTVNIMLTDPYEQNPELSGMEASMHVTVQYIKNPETLSIDALTDEQAAMAFSGDSVSSVQELYDKMRELISEGRNERIRNSACQKICGELLETCQVEPFPTAELDARMDERMEQMAHICDTYYGITLKEYLKQIGMTEKKYRKKNEESVRDAIKLELIFAAIADKENIRYPEGEFEAYVEKILSESGCGSREELFGEYDEDRIRAAFQSEYVSDWLIDNAELAWTEPAMEEDNTDIEASAEPEDSGHIGENIIDKVTAIPLK